MNEGLLLVNKPRGYPSFRLVSLLRKKFNIKKVGHAGTLDPFATGVMVMLIGRSYTTLSDTFLHQDKEYIATLKLGESTDSYDCEGKITGVSDKIPTLGEIEHHLQSFQGEQYQIPPMFSAKKVNGKKLYELAREGKEIERAPAKVHMQTELMCYDYPTLILKISCSKGTYIRSIAHDLGNQLGSFAHLTALERTRVGHFLVADCIDGEQLANLNFDPTTYLIKYGRSF